MTTAISLRTTRVPTHMFGQELRGSTAHIWGHRGAVYEPLISIQFIAEIRCADPRPQSLLQPRGRVTHVDRRAFGGYSPLVVCPRESHETLRTELTRTPVRLRGREGTYDKVVREFVVSSVTSSTEFVVC